MRFPAKARARRSVPRSEGSSYRPLRRGSCSGRRRHECRHRSSSHHPRRITTWSLSPPLTGRRGRRTPGRRGGSSWRSFSPTRSSLYLRTEIKSLSTSSSSRPRLRSLSFCCSRSRWGSWRDGCSTISVRAGDVSARRSRGSADERSEERDAFGDPFRRLVAEGKPSR